MPSAGPALAGPRRRPAPGPAARPAPGWLLRDVLLPFAWTRAALLGVAWFALQFGQSWTYPRPAVALRGFSYTRQLWLDVWGRWDTIWYLDLAAWGYKATGPIAHAQSNIAFFPAYPLLVRAAHALLPRAWQGELGRFAVAVALSNVLAVAGLALVHAYVRARFADPALARRTVLYLLAFPAGFFLSCAYSEALFLFCCAAAFLASARHRFWLAGLAAAAASLARPAGVLLALPLAFHLLEARGWDPRRTFPQALALLLPPLALAGHAANLWRVTGEPLALFHAQAAWGRHLTSPWRTFFFPSGYDPHMGPVEQAALGLFLALGLWLLRERHFAGGAFTLLSLVPILTSGTLMSSVRFLAVLFPAFVALAEVAEGEAADRSVLTLFAMGQAALFVAWTRFYWVA
ncbi:mannosyltransferase family protein [Anaeromyxobacter paludicola]|uniref:Glycosyltransferase RgtA/B/C/D-like domain-containing protein n=1 Tax=Anaeromyxobacter paludicola TaxID=2918171 RepID=A0ABM7XEW5_9BACT|nr:mannosyltransferase family protein [Anaeromyxobacter paludicola]BDG10402.1 hypothetical protein AMPC_35150 [Anaeromyxobacter paludicola]